jgi:hypothetical protein
LLRLCCVAVVFDASCTVVVFAASPTIVVVVVASSEASRCAYPGSQAACIQERAVGTGQNTRCISRKRREARASVSLSSIGREDGWRRCQAREGWWLRCCSYFDVFESKTSICERGVVNQQGTRNNNKNLLKICIQSSVMLSSVKMCAHAHYPMHSSAHEVPRY